MAPPRRALCGRNHPGELPRLAAVSPKLRGTDEFFASRLLGKQFIASADANVLIYDLPLR